MRGELTVKGQTYEVEITQFTVKHKYETVLYSPLHADKDTPRLPDGTYGEQIHVGRGADFEGYVIGEVKK